MNSLKNPGLIRSSTWMFIFLFINITSANAGNAEYNSSENPGDLPLDPAVRPGKLDNGLTYYIRENDLPENRAELWLVVNAGSVLEENDQQGLAHFVEHMAFNGTRRFRKNTMIDFAETAGINFGADLNAYTTYDETVYMLTVPTDDDETISMGLDILEDWAGDLAFEPVEVDKERGVVIEEWRRGRSAGQRISDIQREILLEGSIYTSRLPIGEVDILKNAPVSELRYFYDDWYRPELMAVIVVGDVDAGKIEQEIKLRFNDLEPRGRIIERKDYPVPSIDKTRISVLTDPEYSYSGISLTIKGPHNPVRNEAEYRKYLLSYLFTRMFNSRLAELVQDVDAPFIRAGNNISDFGRTLGLFQLSASPKPGQFEKSLESLMIEFERVRQHGFLQSELERQKISLMRFYERAYVKKEKTTSRSYTREIVNHFLKQETMPGIEVELELVRKLMPGINIEEINALAGEWAARKDRVIMASVPARDPLPEADRLSATLGNIENLDIQPYQENVAGSSLMPVKPEPGRIIEERYLDEIDVTVWTLSNGARVVVKPTEFNEDEIMVNAFSPGGLSLAPDGEYRSAAAATDLISRSGVADFNEITLRKILVGKQVWVRPVISDLEEGIMGNSSVKDLETMMQLIYLNFTAPRTDEAVFKNWKTRIETAIKNRDINPQSLFRQELRAYSNNYHPRSLPMTLPELDRVDLRSAYSFYRDRFANAGDFTFIFVGNIDLERLEELSEAYLASLPATGRQESWRDVGRTRPDGTVSFKLEKGRDPKSYVRISYHGDSKWSLESELDLWLLSEVIDIRLREVLREDMGGVYGASSSGAFVRRPKGRYSFTISFDCAPENVEKLRSAVFEIIDSIKTSGIGQDYIDKIEAQRRRALETSLKTNGFWRGQLIRHYRYGTDPGKLIEETELVFDRLDSDNIKKTANYFLGDNRIDALLMPESMD